ncbi:hypothetical protein GNF10_05860 [Nostoc sp. UCD121]|uniref:hypothetical protein n=1 Tax=unclassified Nostoc TaxID=2593658 RepID=UPI0016270525|nr:MULTISPECIES: hypothetical protein [unclassified Nostoc]MBC1220735.1 hypothetical protein [Nostoc sp. UCD120]MBC1275521.1 hypothetical protein [Nostoc sp. UCD121]MBC1295245.1 hypothetical protein [Nostoc sp. UCD122]
MSLRTRGSAAVDKAQLRLALLKSIDENLDLGHGLTIEAYNHLVNITRATLEAHNTLVSNLEESRKTVTQMDKTLSEMSERMLSGVATIYGRNSIEYSKAGGSNGKRNKKYSSKVAPVVAVLPTQSAQATIANASTNGKSTTPLLQ